MPEFQQRHKNYGNRFIVRPRYLRYGQIDQIYIWYKINFYYTLKQVFWTSEIIVWQWLKSIFDENHINSIYGFINFVDLTRTENFPIFFLARYHRKVQKVAISTILVLMFELKVPFWINFVDKKDRISQNKMVYITYIINYRNYDLKISEPT